MKFFSEAIDDFEPNGRIYIPTASYAEMGQWALPAQGFIDYEEITGYLKQNNLWDKYGYLVRGGFWRNFLSKYPESNNLHKKMHLVADKIDRLAKKTGLKTKKQLAKATNLLYQGECTCQYWHGIFGGLYLSHLRHAAYNCFIRAEVIADKLAGSDGKGNLKVFDFDADNHPEVIVETPLLNAYFSPRYGGAMFELDVRDHGFNLLDTITRRREGYHEKLHQLQAKTEADGKSIHDRIQAKEHGLEKYLIYDWHRRISFVDHCFPPDTSLEAFALNKYDEAGDFIIEPYTYKLKRTVARLKIEFSREGHVRLNNGRHKLHISKHISLSLKKPFIEAVYTVSNRSAGHLNFWLGVEFNWSMLAGNSPDRYYRIDEQKPENASLDSQAETPGATAFNLIDEYHRLDIAISLSEPCRLWRLPIETVSMSEQGFERVYQSSLTCPSFELNLPPGGMHEFTIKISLRDL